MKMIGTLSIFIVVAFLIVGCNREPITEKLSPYESSHFTEAEIKQVESAESQRSLTVWASANIFANQIQTFHTMYPDVEVKVVEVASSEMIEKYMDSINQNETPDIILINDKNLGEFSGIDGLVDLLGKQETDPTFFKQLPKGLIENYKSFHEGKMFAMPMASFPYVTFYRADILEREGFPSNPEQLGIYLQEEENWLYMANKLKGSDHFIFDSTQSLLSTINRSSNYFDEELNYIADQGPMKRALEMANIANQDNLTLNINIWDNNGQQALKEGKLIMLYLPSYIQYHLKEWVANQPGKWRVTSMPLGIVGMDKEAGISLAISSYSENIDLAWEFIKMSSTDMINMYGYENKDPFYGGQDLNQVFKNAMNSDIPGQPTPLDNYASELWELNLYKYTMGFPITEQSLARIKVDVINRIRVERDNILNLYK